MTCLNLSILENLLIIMILIDYNKAIIIINKLKFLKKN